MAVITFTKPEVKEASNKRGYGGGRARTFGRGTVRRKKKMLVSVQFYFFIFYGELS